MAKKYSFEEIALLAGEDPHYRVSDAGDNRIATCYLRENAEKVVELLNSGDEYGRIGTACDTEGAALSAKGTLLWKVDVGEYFWVSARSQVEAVLIVAQHGCLDGVLWNDELTVSVVSEAAARKARFHDPDDPSIETLWDAWLSDLSPCMVGAENY